MKVLVTGAAGQLGRSLPGPLEAHEVAAFARSELDISDLDAVQNAVETEKPDLVINAAAYNRVDDAETDSTEAYRVNALGPRNLALASARIGATIAHVSTDYVFDGRSNRPYHEYDTPNPRSRYGASKLAGELAVRETNPRHYIVRTAWVYHEEGSNFPRTMLSLRNRDEVRVVDDQVGSPTYAPHLAQALTQLVASGAFGTYHLAGTGQASWYELTCRLYRELGIKTRVVPVTTDEFPRPAERPRFSVLGSLQEPRFFLPTWEQGLATFAQRVIYE